MKLAPPPIPRGRASRPGHAVFERRRPAFVDDLSQTLIGPMFVAAKMLVGLGLGLRRDLAPFLAEERREARGPRAG